jgi:hypothetical protein
MLLSMLFLIRYLLRPVVSFGRGRMFQGSTR